MFGFFKKITHEILPPKLSNNPSFDVIITEQTPLLSFLNTKGGPQIRHYEIQLDTASNFNSKNLIVYKNIPENKSGVSEKKVEDKDVLLDKTRYFWRVRMITPLGTSEWAVSRFFVDTASDDSFMEMTRVPVRKISVSEGYNAKNIIDWDDPGLVTFWQSPPTIGKESWVILDFGKETIIGKAWILSNSADSDGWLKDFVIQTSADGKNWKDIPGTGIKNNDTFRNIIDFKPVKTRFVRLLIKEFIGYCAQINEIIFYSPGKPPLPQVPQEDYVLIIGNEHNGYTFTELAEYIKSLNMKFEVVTVPYFEASLEMLNNLPKKPLAIILSGNNADYPNLPMFEHNGEFEIIRKSEIPILGICAGHQFLAMAYGYTRARSMGWSDITAIVPAKKYTHIKILKDDPIFNGIKDNFTAPEIHGWAVVEPAAEFEVIAASSYIQVQKSNKRLIYGAQFHAEINSSYNHARSFIRSFLEMAMKKNPGNCK